MFAEEFYFLNYFPFVEALNTLFKLFIYLLSRYSVSNVFLKTMKKVTSFMTPIVEKFHVLTTDRANTIFSRRLVELLFMRAQIVVFGVEHSPE